MRWTAWMIAAGATVLTGACASGPSRMYNMTGPDFMYSAAQRETAAEWMRNRGIYNHVVYGVRTISFKYGSDDVRTMTYTEFDDFVRSRIEGYTVASARRPDYQSSERAEPAAIIYYAADGHFHQWSHGASAGATVLSGRWWFEGVPEADMARARRLGVEPPRRVICYDSGVSGRLPVCSPMYEQISGIHGKQAGDVFALVSGTAPAAMMPEYPSEWPDGSPLFPERAPHD